MSSGAEPKPALSRVEAGGVLRGLFDAVPGRLAFARDWDGVRAFQIRAEPMEVPEGYLVNHAVMLNLGADASYESRFDGAGWLAHRLPHHGLAVFPAELPYAARGRDVREYLFVELDRAFVGNVLGVPGGPDRLRPVAGAQDAFAKHVLLAIAEEARSGSAASGALRAQSLATALVAHLTEKDVCARATAQAQALPSPKLRRVLEYVAAHLDAPLTLQRLAELAEVDVFRFIRSFKQSTGLSPHRYVLEARITRAKALLADRALSITDVALQTGFATPSHFSVTFRRLASVTPREYRDALE